jgi:hypothetical protein
MTSTISVIHLSHGFSVKFDQKEMGRKLANSIDARRTAAYSRVGSSEFQATSLSSG